MKFLRWWIEELFNVKIFNKLPFGVDSFEDIDFYFKSEKLDVFFDVGANVGQSVKAIKKQFKHSKIYCFEPFLNTFNELTQNVNNFENVNCYQFGFAASSQKIEVKTGGQSSDMYSISNQDTAEGSVSELIELKTIDEFCKENRFNKIDYLKIDTEGYDLEVLKGSINMLQSSNISFIEAEVSMNPDNKFHVDFFRVKEYLEQYGYRLYGIYDQVYEWSNNSAVLRRANVVFLSPKLAFKKYKS